MPFLQTAYFRKWWALEQEVHFKVRKRKMQSFFSFRFHVKDIILLVFYTDEIGRECLQYNFNRSHRDRQWNTSLVAFSFFYHVNFKHNACISEKSITLLFGRSYLLSTLSHQDVHEQLYSRNWSVIVFVPRLERGMLL